MANSPLGTVLSRLRTILELAVAEATDRELLRRFVAACDQAAFGDDLGRGVAMLGANASILASDQAAFGELVRRHGPMVLGVCRRLLGDAHAAEDAFQAVFLVLVRRARAVPWRESLGGWLHGTARRVALRAKSRTGRGFDADRVPAPAASPDPSEEAAARELRCVLDQELQRLPAKYRAPLVLCDMEGKTHEQAARELGWPKGSLAKRLNGAREQLRARLVRRGVTLSAGALAAFTLHEVTAAPPAALAAAAMLAAEGVASTTAAALAKGVMQAMWITKIKTAVLMTALAVAGALAGVGAYRAWGARAAAPAPEANPSPAPAEDKKVMPIDKAVVYNVAFAQAGEAFAALSDGAAAVADRPAEIKANVQLFLSAVEENRKRVLSIPAGPHLALLAVGPPLDFGDAAVAVGLTRRGDKLDLEIAYTSGRAEGKQFRRSAPWRPLVQVPVDLTPGRYQLTVTWQARKSLPAGDAWSVPPTVSTCEFTVTGGDRAESKAVRVEGLEFTALAPARVAIPPAGQTADVDLGLRIVNVSDKPITLAVSNVINPRLVTPDGKEPLKPDLGRRGLLLPKPPATLASGDSWTWRPEARLQWTADRAALQLCGPDGRGVPGFWCFGTLHAGKYGLIVGYSNSTAKQDDVAVWVGKALTEPVDFEITSP